MRVICLLPILLCLAGCTISTPFRPTGEASVAAPGRQYVVAVTEATLGDDAAARDRFWTGVRRIQAALPKQEGLIGYRFRRELLGSRAWTLTVWRSEADLDRFVQSEVHLSGSREGYAAVADMRTARFRWAADGGTPSWEEAEARLAAKAGM